MYIPVICLQIRKTMQYVQLIQVRNMEFNVGTKMNSGRYFVRRFLRGCMATEESDKI